MSEMAQNEQDTTESGSAPLATYEGWGANRLPNQVGDPLVLVALVLRTFLPGNALLAALGLSEDGVLAPVNSPPSAQVGTN